MQKPCVLCTFSQFKTLVIEIDGYDFPKGQGVPMMWVKFFTVWNQMPKIRYFYGQIPL